MRRICVISTLIMSAANVAAADEKTIEYGIVCSNFAHAAHLGRAFQRSEHIGWMQFVMHSARLRRISTEGISYCNSVKNMRYILLDGSSNDYMQVIIRGINSGRLKYSSDLGGGYLIKTESPPPVMGELDTSKYRDRYVRTIPLAAR